MLRDAGGTVWRCIGSNDGAVDDLSVVEGANDGQGSMAGAASEGTASTEHVRFAAGTSGTEIDDGFMPGSSTRGVLGAQNGQFLDVRVMPQEPGISYQIFNPDGSLLLDMVDAGQSMLQQHVGSLLKSEVVQLRRQAASFGMILASAVFIALAVGFVLLAAFLALSNVMAPGVAALIVGLATALLGLMLMIRGRQQLRPRGSRDVSIDATLRARMGRQDGTSVADDTLSPFGLVVSATLIGIILGQKLKK